MSLSVLVTGGAGFVGSHMVLALHEAGHRVVVLDDLSTGHRDAVLHGELRTADLTDKTAVRAALAGHDFDAVMHFAAKIDAPASVADPSGYYRVNLVGSLNLLDVMLERNIRAMIFSSTCAIFGDASGRLDETAPRLPVSPYGFSKLAVERALADYARSYRMDSVSLRYFNAAGADRAGRLRERHDPETHLIPRLLRTARAVLRGEAATVDPIRVFGTDWPTPDGTCVRDYVHVEDLCRAHLSALERLVSTPGRGAEAFNLGSARGHSVREVIRATEAVTGARLPFEAAPRRPGDVATLIAANERAREVLAWTPELVDLEAIIRTAWHAEGPP